MDGIEKEVLDALIAKSVEVKGKAYAPYSSFPVGAALLTDTGHIFTGCNVENASSGLTICAERSAVCKAVSEGHQKFKAVAVSTDLQGQLTSPCGACRQVLAEFAAPDFLVILIHPKGDHEHHLLSDLLPFSFGPKVLDLFKEQKSNS